jgi:hypothetical protein
MFIKEESQLRKYHFYATREQREALTRKFQEKRNQVNK